jgi:hypothetical protein
MVTLFERTLGRIRWNPEDVPVFSAQIATLSATVRQFGGELLLMAKQLRPTQRSGC